MSVWKPYILNPTERKNWDQEAPSNWCILLRNNSNEGLLAKWSKSSYCWIGLDLLPIDKLPYFEDNNIHIWKYRELDFKTLTDIYKGGGLV